VVEDLETGLLLKLIRMEDLVVVVEELHLTPLKVLEELVHQDKDILVVVDLLDLYVMVVVVEVELVLVVPMLLVQIPPILLVEMVVLE
jgi:hypothetical protein